MIFAFYLLLFMFGSSVGSFVNVVAFRHNTGLSPLKGTSQCFSCGTKLRYYDMFPVLSYLFLRGRCRDCSTKLSPFYFLAEVVSGLFAVFLSQWSPSILQFIILFGIAETLLAVFIYDLRHKIIPDSFIIIFGILSLTYSYFVLQSPVSSLLYGLLLVPLPFFLIWLASAGRYIGFGDVKLMAAMGALLGVKEGFSAVLISFWIGFVYVSLAFIYHLAFKLLGLRGRGKEITMKSELPFAPFLVVGSLLGLFLNIDIISNVLVQ
jgi:leader peptidase (prepilin peptidase) / N-methyltransferase